MFVSSRNVRHGIVGALGAGAVAGALLVGAPSALADQYPDPVPGCSAGDFEQVTAQVSAATSVYFYTHPDVNAFFSTLKGQPRDVVKGEIGTYLDANPQVAKDMQTLQRPLTDLAGQCKLPITVPQVLGLMQNAQQGGGLPGGLPGTLPGAQTVGVPGSALPAQSSPASAITQGTGPLPGPATIATR